MPRLMLTLLVMCLLGLAVGPAVAAQSPPPSFPPPGPPYPDRIEGVRVYDYARVLHDDTIASLEAGLDAFEEISGVETVVYTQVKPESDTPEEAEADAAALSGQWGIGPDGLVFLLDLASDRCTVVGSVHSDRANDAARRIGDVEQSPIFDAMLPFLRECDIDGAVLAFMEVFAPGAEPVGVGLPAPLPFLGFGLHAAQTQDRSRMQMDAVLASLEANDLDEASRALGPLIDIHTEELAWLDDHPPGDCYRRLYEDYRSANEALASGEDLWRQGLLDSDPALFQRGTEELSVAGESLKRVTAAFEQVTLDCLAGSATPGPRDSSATAPEPPEDSLVLQDATGDLSGFATLEPTDGPAYTDLTGLAVMVDGETLAVRFDVAGAVPEAPDPTDTTVYYFLAIDTDGDDFPNYHLDLGSEDGWTTSLFDYDTIAITHLGAAIVEDASLTGSVPLTDLGSPTELRVRAWMEASHHPDPSGDPQDVTRWTDRVPDYPTEWAALGASTP